MVFWNGAARRTCLASRLALAVLPLLAAIGPTPAFGQDTSFTYQGRLTDAGAPANGSYDFQFSLWDDPAGGTQLGPTLTFETSPGPVTVTGGLFSVLLDFGPVFTGGDRYLQIAVKKPADPSYTAINPRQRVTS